MGASSTRGATGTGATTGAGATTGTGATTVTFDTSELAVLTQEMLAAGFSEAEVGQVMGGNVVRFLPGMPVKRMNNPAGWSLWMSVAWERNW